jgi:TolB-like protein/Tfp pilus assembly protein PilF
VAPESENNLRLEIGHVLFIDLVGYSKLLIEEQKERMRQLTDIVLATTQVRAATNEQLVRLPSGDGMALVFRNSSEEPAQCALELAQALKAHPEISFRMGIHSGPVSEGTDVNDRPNIAGAGINIAQRVMDCGDAGHILLSQRVADDLAQYRRWSPRLYDLGECEVKHGVRLRVFNFYTAEFGNSAVPEKFKKRRKSKPRPAVSSRRPVRKIPTVSEKSIAVLPFENRSEDKANAYFAEGIQDEILTRLAKIADLKVISRTSTQHFKNSPDNLPEIARQLGVAHILEGSVQKANDQVRVNVQLINAATDAHLWADIFDRKLTDIFAVESEIAKTIAETLQAKLTGSEERAIAARPTENPEAYQLYLKGRFFWNKLTAVDLRKSIDYFQQAIEKDPNYALAYAGLAQAWLLLSRHGGAPKDCFPQAETAAKKALSLDDNSADALTALASVKAEHNYDLAGALIDYERAIQLQPNNAMVHHRFAMTLASVGRSEHAITEMKRSLIRDPLSLITNTNLGVAYISAGQLDEAIAQLRNTVEMDGSFYFGRSILGVALELKGQIPEAMAEHEKAIALSDDPLPQALLGQLYGTIGLRAEATKILTKLKEARQQRYIDAYSLVLIYLGLGDRDQALSWLEQGFQEHSPWLMAIRVSSLLKPLHGDPRFEALAEKIVPAREFGPTPAPK